MTGSVALTDRTVAVRGLDETHSPSGPIYEDALGVHWFPFPARRRLSYRDLEELLAERGIEVDHVTMYRWVQRFTPLLIDAARPCRHLAGDRWFVDETYVKLAGVWSYVYRASTSIRGAAARAGRDRGVDGRPPALTSA
jgi:hypothetical protein